MNNILVPTDFSDAAQKAAHYALGLALQSNATVYLFHAYTAFHSGFQTATDNSSDERRAADEAREAMALFLEAVHDSDADVNVVTICRKGGIVGLIREFASTVDLDLIVMGTSGATGIKYQFFGTNTYDVAESLAIPLLVVPTQTQKSAISHIAFFADYRHDDHQTIASLYALFGSDQMNYTVVHIHEKEKPPMDSDFKRLAAYAMELQANTPITNMDWEMVHGKENIEMVHQIVDTLQIDLLAITMAQRNFLDKLLDKSLSKEIVMQARTPVFIGR